MSAPAAGKVIELRAAGPGSGSYRWRCAATGFADARTVVGVCQEQFYDAVKYDVAQVVGSWVTTWDFSGNPTVNQSRPAAWPGCVGTQSVVMINGVPMYYIGADASGNMLTENNCQSYLVTS